MKLRLRRYRKQVTSPLYPTFSKRINDAVDLIIERQVTPWAFLTAGPPFRVERFDKRQIAYQGIGFEGSPRVVFWGRYIEPFLEDLCISEIEKAVEIASLKKVDARKVLPEVEGLLSAGFRRVYDRMTLIDQRLRGKGFPNKVQPRSAESQLRAMNQFLDELVRAELATWRPVSLLERWYERNQFWVWAIPKLGVWAIPIVLAAVGLARKFR